MTIERGFDAEKQKYLQELKEVAESCKRSDPSLWAKYPDYKLMRSVLNNIHYRFFVTWKLMSEDPERWSKKQDLVTKSGESVASQVARGFSEKFCTQSIKERAEDLKEAVTTCGLTVDEVDEAIDRFDEGINNKDDLERIWLPIYLELRKMGYTHTDIIA